MTESSAQEIDVRIDWASVKDWESAIAALESVGEIVEASEAFGDGSELISTEDKKKLEGVPFLMLEWRFVTDVKTDREYVNCLIMLKDSGRKIRFNDGSTGVCQQIREYEDRTGRTSGIYCPRGLRASEYIHEDEKGNKSEAVTYYIG